MKKWHKFTVWISVALLFLAAQFVFLIWQNHVKRERVRRELANPPPPGFRLPPKDLSAWFAECGANEPDSSTPQGKARLQDEERRLPEARKEFLRLMDSRKTVLMNEDDGEVRDFLGNMTRLLDGFSRGNCIVVMRPAETCWGGGNPNVPFKSIVDEQQCERLIERYYLVHCQLADWFWIRCGSEYDAACMDVAIFTWLVRTREDCERRGWTTACKTIDHFLEIHRRDRCDSEKSNICRAHRWGEKLYDNVYVDIIKKDPRWVKGTIKWHGAFLKSARYYLGREPKWNSPVDSGVRPE